MAPIIKLKNPVHNNKLRVSLFVSSQGNPSEKNAHKVLQAAGDFLTLSQVSLAQFSLEY